ncbi:rCG36733 [Rattus norvegicus]|uniref:RCG36733 n=1 Tax=Rattus norvegicus TaxID=10116 RepID=A6JS26_RAT|nr:rCG36733 [Rattus norvegicus]
MKWIPLLQLHETVLAGIASERCPIDAQGDGSVLLNQSLCFPEGRVPERVHGEGRRSILVLGFPSTVSRVLAPSSTWLYLTSSRADISLSQCIEVGNLWAVLQPFSDWISVSVS